MPAFVRLMAPLQPAETKDPILSRGILARRSQSFGPAQAPLQSNIPHFSCFLSLVRIVLALTHPLWYRSSHKSSRGPVIPRQGTTRQQELAGEAAQAKENPVAATPATLQGYFLHLHEEAPETLPQPRRSSLRNETQYHCPTCKNFTLTS